MRPNDRRRGLTHIYSSLMKPLKAYAILSARRKHMETFDSRLPIFWYKKTAEEEAEKRGVPRERVVVVYIADNASPIKVTDAV